MGEKIRYLTQDKNIWKRAVIDWRVTLTRLTVNLSLTPKMYEIARLTFV